MQHPLVAAALGAVVFSFAVEAACAASNDLPLIDHIVVVVMENHSFDQIVDPLRAPFLHRLAMDGALFVNSFAVTHPSQPNYFALFSGSTQGITDDEDHTPALSRARERVLSGMSKLARHASTILGSPLLTLVRPSATSVSSRVSSRSCQPSALSFPASITICMTDRCAWETIGSGFDLIGMPNGRKLTTAC